MPSSRPLPGTKHRPSPADAPEECTKACNPDPLRPSLVIHVGRRAADSPIAPPPRKVPEAPMHLPPRPHAGKITLRSKARREGRTKARNPTSSCPRIRQVSTNTSSARRQGDGFAFAVTA
ncbi:hypothetical protein BKA80DRAFT_251100 [Phyllosticta citrichinensis]